MFPSKQSMIILIIILLKVTFVRRINTIIDSHAEVFYYIAFKVCSRIPCQRIQLYLFVIYVIQYHKSALDVVVCVCSTNLNYCITTKHSSFSRWSGVILYVLFHFFQQQFNKAWSLFYFILCGIITASLYKS